MFKDNKLLPRIWTNSCSQNKYSPYFNEFSISRINLLDSFSISEHCAMDTSTYARDIQNVSMYGKFMISFDVESLAVK